MATKNVVLKDSNSNELNPQTTITQIKDSSGNALFSVSGTGISTANSYTINGASITDSSITSGKIENLQLNKLVDSDEHNRFIGDDITPGTTNITWRYTKWTLSGTHLMIVLAGFTGTEFGAGELNITINLPAWIKSKIYPIASEHTPLVSMVNATARATGVAYDSPRFVLIKSSSSGNPITIENIDVVNSQHVNQYVFRIQFDLVIE